MGISNFQEIAIKSKVAISKTQPAFEGKYTEEDYKNTSINSNTKFDTSMSNNNPAQIPNQIKTKSKVDQVKDIQEKIMANLIQQRKMIEKDLMKERGFKPVKTVSDIPKEIKPIRAGFNRGITTSTVPNNVSGDDLNQRKQFSSSFNATAASKVRGKSANIEITDPKKKKDGIFSKANFSYLGLFKKK